MASVQIINLSKSFGKVQAVAGLSFEVADGEFFCLLGPPGAGKTTTLRLIAGLEKPDSGQIRIGGEPMNGVHPMDRDVAMVFEDVALYPHWTGFDNIAHPLRLRKVPAPEIRRRVMEVAEMLRITHLLDRKPGTFSGGERRRVAIGRALVRRPRVLLLDQPLTDLDAKIRQEMSNELKRLQAETRQTMVYATHDFEEAVGMADRIMVINHGKEEQTGTAEEIYETPQTTFVATFVGTPAMNLIRCQTVQEGDRWLFRHPDFHLQLPPHNVIALPPDVIIGIRPEHIVVVSESDPHAIPARVDIVQILGEEQIVDLSLQSGTLIKAIFSLAIDLRPGDRLSVRFPPERLVLFDGKNEQRITLPAG
jgi:multiple sugar transport system ATP-binding protein